MKMLEQANKPRRKPKKKKCRKKTGRKIWINSIFVNAWVHTRWALLLFTHIIFGACTRPIQVKTPNAEQEEKWKMHVMWYGIEYLSLCRFCMLWFVNVQKDIRYALCSVWFGMVSWRLKGHRLMHASSSEFRWVRTTHHIELWNYNASGSYIFIRKRWIFFHLKMQIQCNWMQWSNFLFARSTVFFTVLLFFSHVFFFLHTLFCECVSTVSTRSYQSQCVGLFFSHANFNLLLHIFYNLQVSEHKHVHCTLACLMHAASLEYIY